MNLIRKDWIVKTLAYALLLVLIAALETSVLSGWRISGAAPELLRRAFGGLCFAVGLREVLAKKRRAARVMLCLPPMLILDEATSSIDTRTEVRIQKAFARMMQGRTSFIVAHRLSTIREADVILVMKDGHIVEQGNHDQLLAQGGFYAKLYNSQFEGVQT